MIELTSQSRVSKASQPCQSVLPPMQATLRVRWGKRWSSSTWASPSRVQGSCKLWSLARFQQISSQSLPNKFLHGRFPKSPLRHQGSVPETCAQTSVAQEGVQVSSNKNLWLRALVIKIRRWLWIQDFADISTVFTYVPKLKLIQCFSFWLWYNRVVVELHRPARCQ